MFELESDNPLKGLEYLNKIIEIEPNNYSPYYYRGLSYYKLKDYERSISEIDLALEKHLKFAFEYDSLREFQQDRWRSRVISEKGDILFQIKEYEKAVHSYFKATVLNPFNYKIWASLSVTRRKLNLDIEANKSLSKAKELYSLAIKTTRKEGDVSFVDKMKVLYLTGEQAGYKNPIEVYGNNKAYYKELSMKIMDKYLKDI